MRTIQYLRRWVGPTDEILHLAHRLDVRTERGTTIPLERWAGLERVDTGRG
jgi:hypothetical protein